MPMRNISLRQLFSSLDKQDNFVFLETNKATQEDRKSYLFIQPSDIVSCTDHEKIKPSLDRIDRFLRKGYFAAGFLSYEAGAGFEEALKKKKEYGFPLLRFGIYKDPIIYDHNRIKFVDGSSGLSYSLSRLHPKISQKEYISSVKKIKSYIEKGHTYQVNYTFKLDFSFEGSVFDLYLDLRRNQSVSYSALIKFGNEYIVSFSPELFFKRDGNYIKVKPMKGTADRGRYLKEDSRNKEALHLSPKDKSENIMIVDLLRNDLGRISKTDTVKTVKLFEIEQYESLLQMTSTVESRLHPRISSYELFKAIFPSGSVTGAPKIRTMQIIEKLEKTPRRIYTGSIGFISPKNIAAFNIAIRTLLIDTRQKRGEMGIGSGIVYDSDAKKEYEECRLKAKFFTEQNSDFKIIETMLWDKQNGCTLLKFHRERLLESAEYFDFLYNEKAILKILQELRISLDKGKKYRVRLLLSKEGEPEITYTPIEADKSDRFLTFSKRKTSSFNKFLFHKTTNRKVYDEEYKACKEKGFCDIIFRNEKNEITEGAISNIFIKKGRKYYTPPVECGLLNGVCRRYLLKKRNFPVEEKILYEKDMVSADEILLTNAVRGIVKVKPIMKAELARV